LFFVHFLFKMIWDGECFTTTTNPIPWLKTAFSPLINSVENTSRWENPRCEFRHRVGGGGGGGACECNLPVVSHCQTSTQIPHFVSALCRQKLEREGLNTLSFWDGGKKPSQHFFQYVFRMQRWCPRRTMCVFKVKHFPVGRRALALKWRKENTTQNNKVLFFLFFLSLLFFLLFHDVTATFSWPTAGLLPVSQTHH